MNVKELLLIIGLALVTTWTIDYFFLGKHKADQQNELIKSGQSFVAPKKEQTVKPINTEVDFVDTKRSAPEIITSIETDHASMTFSTDGASLERLEFKRIVDGWPQTMTTIFPLSNTEKENRCFLVALDKETPYYYSLADKRENQETITLTYQAETPEALIKKVFIIYKKIYKIDLLLTLKPKGSTPQEARVFYPAPVMPDVSDDVKSAIVSDEKGKLLVIPRSTLDTNMYWYQPTLFGVENRYFVHAMIGKSIHAQQPDISTNFTQRGYIKLSGQKELYAIIESPSVTQETSWQVSFYFGPKEECAMSCVDVRLEQTLGYAGWFAPIAKWLLRLLQFLYHYLHNYGLAIIALTLLTKLILLPFSLKGAQSMKKHSDVQRKLKYLQQKYKDDIETLNRERTELMRKEGLPGMVGCLPVLLQLPIFFALSRVLSTSIDLYQAPFFGWITDLSARDPYYILPILTGLVMLLQAATVDSKQRVQVVVMAVIFGAITANLAAGLVLYILMSTLLSIIQTVLQQRFKMA